MQHGSFIWTVSSVLPPKENQEFGPRNFYYGEGAWCTGRGSTGIGQWMKVEYEQPMEFQKIFVMNGNAQDKQTFYQYNRIKQLKLELANQQNFIFSLQDTPVEQQIELPTMQRAKWIRLTILSIYLGKNTRATCLTQFVPDYESHSSH